jgi:hypothetical protein
MSISDTNEKQTSRIPIVLGMIALLCYLLFIGSSFFLKGGWINELLQEHYVFFVGLPFSGFLAYFIVGTLESVRGEIEFEAMGIKFKGASGPIIMWVFVFLAIVISIRLVWNLPFTIK